MVNTILSFCESCFYSIRQVFNVKTTLIGAIMCCVFLSVVTPAHALTESDELTCSNSSLYSLKSSIIYCVFLGDPAASLVTVSYRDGLVPSPVPSTNKVSSTRSFSLNSSNFSFPLTLWKSTDVFFVFKSNSNEILYSTSKKFNVKPSISPISYPDKAVLKKNHFSNPDPRPLGTGVNSSVNKVPSSVRKFMSGVSHQSSCVPFRDLRLISFNYYSIDGFMYRGFLVSHKSVAGKVRSIVDSLFDLKFPLHSAHLPDVYGVAPSGKGANDYKSMASGNTSMFNCRYVVGRERDRVLSPHASGKSIDINTWENPYASRTGVYPNRFWFDNRLNHPLVFSKNHKVVKLLESHGFSWGGSFKDYHHFQL